MQIALSGYRGLIGRSLEKKLKELHHEVVRLSREDLYDREGDDLVHFLRGCDAVVHLAGAPILQRWTAENRKEILESRTLTTRHLAAALQLLPLEKRPRTFLSASAIGIYKAGATHDEESRLFDDHFAAEVTRQWEEASEQLPDEVRRIIFRISLVLDRKSKLIEQLWLPYRLGLGGPIGSGKQPFPFIHLDDLTSAIVWALENSHARGVYNLTAPDSVTNRQFARRFATFLHRPAFIPLPGFVLRLLYGEAAQLITESPAVVPRKLVTEGFTFRYPTLSETLAEITASKQVI